MAITLHDAGRGALRAISSVEAPDERKVVRPSWKHDTTDRANRIRRGWETEPSHPQNRIRNPGSLGIARAEDRPQAAYNVAQESDQQIR